MADELHDENILVQQLDDQEEISRHSPMPSHRSATTDISVHGATPNDVLHASQFKPVKPNNHFVIFDQMRMNGVIKSILQGHPIAYSLTKTVDVPEVYVQQVWHNIVKIRSKHPYFHITVDRFETQLSYRRLRTILRFPGPEGREGRDAYDPFPSDAEVLQGILAMGYNGELRQSSDFYKVYLPPHWYDLFSILNRCLTSKATGIDRATMSMIKLFYCIVHDLHVDYTLAIWTDLTDVVNDKFNKRDRSFVPFYRFLQLIVQSVIDSTDEFPNRADWPRAQHHQCKYFQKQDHHFTNNLDWMLVPRSLVEEYADPSDPAVIDFLVDLDEYEEMMAEFQTAPIRERRTKQRHDVQSAPLRERRSKRRQEVVHEDVNQEHEDQDMEETHVACSKNVETSSVHETAHVEEEHHQADDQTGFSDWNEGVIGDDNDDDGLDEDDDNSDDDNDDSHAERTAIVLVSSSSEPTPTFTVNLPPSTGLSSVVFDRPLQRMNLFSMVTSSMTLSTVTATVSITAASTFASTPSTPAALFATTVATPSTTTRPSFPTFASFASSARPRGLDDFSTSDLVEHLQGRLLSMAPANQQSTDLVSLLRSFQAPSAQPASSSSSAKDDIAALRSEVREFKAHTDFRLASLESMLMEIGKHLQVPNLSCSAQADTSSKRPHDHDDDPHRDHEGEKRRRVYLAETVSRRETDQSTEDVAVEKMQQSGGQEDRSDRCYIFDEILERTEASSHSETTHSEADTMQLVVFMDPSVDPISSILPETVSEADALNIMRSSCNIIYIDSDAEDEGREDKSYEEEIKFEDEEEEEQVDFGSSPEHVEVITTQTDSPSIHAEQDVFPPSDKIETPVTSAVETPPVTTTSEVHSHIADILASMKTLPSKIPPAPKDKGKRKQVASDVAPDFIPTELQGPSVVISRDQRKKSLEDRHLRTQQRQAFLEISHRSIFANHKQKVDAVFVFGLEKESELMKDNYLKAVKYTRQPRHLVYSEKKIVQVKFVTMVQVFQIWFASFTVQRQDTRDYDFSGADFHSLHIDDIEFLFHFFKDMTDRSPDMNRAFNTLRRHIIGLTRFYMKFDFQIGVENNQPKIILMKPRQSLENIEKYSVYTVLDDPHGVIFVNQGGNRSYMYFDEVMKYSDGTLKLVKFHLTHRLNNEKKNLADRLRFNFSLAKDGNQEISRLLKALDVIQERLNLRAYIRRLEALIDFRRLQEESSAPEIPKGGDC